MKNIMRYGLFLLLAFMVAISASSCVVSARGERGVWVRGHYDYYGGPGYHHRHWVRGHWNH